MGWTPIQRGNMEGIHSTPTTHKVFRKMPLNGGGGVLDGVSWTGTLKLKRKARKFFGFVDG